MFSESLESLAYRQDSDDEVANLQRFPSSYYSSLVGFKRPNKKLPPKWSSNAVQ